MKRKRGSCPALFTQAPASAAASAAASASTAASAAASDAAVASSPATASASFTASTASDASSDASSSAPTAAVSIVTTTASARTAPFSPVMHRAAFGGKGSPCVEAFVRRQEYFICELVDVRTLGMHAAWIGNGKNENGERVGFYRSDLKAKFPTAYLDGIPKIVNYLRETVDGDKSNVIDATKCLTFAASRASPHIRYCVLSPELLFDDAERTVLRDEARAFLVDKVNCTTFMKQKWLTEGRSGSGFVTSMQESLLNRIDDKIDALDLLASLDEEE